MPRRNIDIKVAFVNTAVDYLIVLIFFGDVDLFLGIAYPRLAIILEYLAIKLNEESVNKRTRVPAFPEIFNKVIERLFIKLLV